MSSLRLYTSNRLERLAWKLADLISTPLASPLDKEVIIVQSKGMERWVSMELAGHHGICANIRFPFPNGFIHETLQGVIPDLPEKSSYDPLIMTWRIMKLLPSLIQGPDFETLRAYVKEGEEGLKIYQLAERIADTFDQYLLFRPEMIFRWEKGEEDHWQAALWRELVKGNEEKHRAALGKALFEMLERPASELTGLGERVSVFGISALPRFHMQVFAAMSRFTEVNVFLMNPCKEYWGDIFSDWDMTRAAVREGTQDLATEDLHIEKGNSLLASMGKLGRDFFDLINEFPCEEFEFFEGHEEDDLLSRLQSDILNLRDVQQKPDEKRIVDVNDDSVRIHSCHSPMREIEVLHDQLLRLFENDPELCPKDILVMTPDIETYSPYIQAAFDMPDNDGERIPFSIADRTIRKESEIIDAFLAILDLCGSRFGASQVMDVLESHAVRRRFGLRDTDLDLVRRWVQETRIRWGIDGQSHVDLGLPVFEENTWKAGLERLLLGYAMPGQDENMFAGVLPYDHVEGGDALILGGLAEFTDRLFTHVTSLGEPRTLSEWSDALKRLLEDLFMPDEATEREIQVIRYTLNDLDDIQKTSGFSKRVDIKIIKCLLEHNFEKEGFASGFITGGVTFCAMLPMRSIPFKVICLVGMNNDAYPRQTRQLGFDLIAEHPQPGDRSRRDDDRYLFLEAMLSVRQKLYISHVGQSIQDNSPVPPSVLVSELMDYIEQGFEIPGAGLLDRIVTKHRLQAFSPEYFKENERLFSYSRENLQAAQCIQKARKAPVPFISKGLSDPPDEDWRTVDIDDLCSFFRNPARYLLTKRLDIYLGERTSLLEEREAFDFKGLERYLLEEDLMKRRFGGRNTRDFLPLTRASGLLPHGTVGECVFEELNRGVEGFVEKTMPYMQGTTLAPIEADLQISDFRLTGRIDAIYPEWLMRYRYARTRPKDRLDAWIHHLVLNSLGPDGYPQISVLAGFGPGPGERKWSAWKYLPVEESEDILGDLLEKYWQGLVWPLHFFPESSWEYVQKIRLKDKSEEDALESARKIWIGNDFMVGGGECEDAYYKLCFNNSDPLDLEFQTIGEEIFRPLMEHEEEFGSNGH